MLRYSPDAQAALPKFFEKFYDLDVFVEDVANPGMYEVLLERLLSKDIRFRVYPLGNRERVIERCKKSRRRKRKKVFLIDGDFHFARDDPRPLNDARLFVWSAYCVENFLMQEKAVVEVCRELRPDLLSKAIRKNLKFRQNFRLWVQRLFPLFVRYAVCAKCAPAEATVGFGAGKLCSLTAGVHSLDKAKVKERIKKIEGVIFSEIKKSAAKHLFRKLSKHAGATVEGRSRVISGKSYLLPLLSFHLRAAMKVGDRSETLKIRLMRHVDVSAFSKFSEFLAGHVAAKA